MYLFVFAALFLTGAGRIFGLDGSIGTRLGRFSFLASGRVSETDKPATA